MSKTKKEASRKKSLGEIGELYALKALVDHGYKNITNINDKTRNEKFADLYCEKDGEKLIVSVKARNKFTNKQKVNSAYKLGQNSQTAIDKAKYAEKKYKAKAYGMALQFDEKTYSVFIVSLKELHDKHKLLKIVNYKIPIKECENKLIGKILEKDKPHYIDWQYFTNQEK
jgi:hypothetical protein